MKLRWLTGVGLLVGLGALATGCAQERRPINRVQAMALPKSFFVGEKLQDASDDPEFYTQSFITDVPYGAGGDMLFTVGFGGYMSRVRFEISQDYLIARITYERIDGSDAHGLDPAKKDGVIAGVWRIKSQFDIRRSYNPQTGEEMNVIEENQSDRPWYEREYMRVDWSENLNTDSYDFDMLSWIGGLGGYKYEPLRYEVNDPNHPDAPHFSEKDGYFDVTVKAFAQPQMIDLSHMGWGLDKLPACWLENDFFNGTAPVGSCNPVEIKIRQSFLRIKNTDYEPVNWDGRMFAAYGAFYTDRYGYDKEYGMRDEKWRRFINRYNIWERSHYYDDAENLTGAVACNVPSTTPAGLSPHRDEDHNGTEDECEVVTEKLGVSGSRCDEFTHKCTLPFRARVAKPLAWHYTSNDEKTYDRYFQPVAWATDEWDAAMRSAVSTARYAECKRTGGQNCAEQYPVLTGQQVDNEDLVQLAHEVDLCRQKNGYDQSTCNEVADQIGAERHYSAGVIGIAKQPEMVTLCHNPVIESDHPACGAPGTIARLGDLRYHQVNSITQPQSPSPWGIMVSSDDPSTGEEIMLSANSFTWVNDYVAQRTVDYMRFIKGELSVEDVTEAKYVKDWVAAANVEGAGGPGGIMPMLTQDQLIQRLASVGNIKPETMREVLLDPKKFAKEHPNVMHTVNLARAYVETKEMNAEVTDTQQAIISSRLKNAQGSEFEARLASRPMVQRAGLKGLPLDQGSLQWVSPLRGNNPEFTNKLKALKELSLAHRNMCMIDAESVAPEGTSLSALATELLDHKFSMEAMAGYYENWNQMSQMQQRRARAEKVKEFLARRFQYSVLTHELGHSIGLRHNFVGSADAMIFRPQYWQLRTKNGTVTDECTGPRALDKKNCVGPRYYDPMTKEEDEQMIHMFEHGSIMDYPGEISQDLNGLGVWDFAAARMFYGQTVAVYAEDLPVAVKGGMLNKEDNFGGILGMKLNTYGQSFGGGGTLVSHHYTEYQKVMNMIHDCYEVDPNKYRPSDWDESVYGKWNPLLDGHIVKVDGKYTRCYEKPVDHVEWRDLRQAVPTDLGADPSNFPSWILSRGGPAVVKNDNTGLAGHIRVPYGFATDSWADLGNLSVYRHDSGADPYELFQFFISQQELGHIWKDYRRGKQSFSVRSSSGSTYGRYNTKMRDGAKGLGLFATMYKDIVAATPGDPQLAGNYDLFLAAILSQLRENALASAMAFDQFTRMYQRPHIGPHYKDRNTLIEDLLPPGTPNPLQHAGDHVAAKGGGVYRAKDDSVGEPQRMPKHEHNGYLSLQWLNVPNGTAGSRYGNVPDADGNVHGGVIIGGHLVNNKLAEDRGEYDRDYTMTCGSYYDKAYTGLLLGESVDNFISSSRNDFVDPRYRAVSIADLFPEGYRRFIANMLTDDDFIKDVRVSATEPGVPQVDKQGFAKNILWTSWWPASGPELCTPVNGTWECMDPANAPNSQPHPDTSVAPWKQNYALVDPQVGWEQQKFLIANTLLMIPENQQQHWLDLMRIWELGRDADPQIDRRIEFHDPETGHVYIARAYGKEKIFGKTVQRGIGARVLEWANHLVERGYVTCTDADVDHAPGCEAKNMAPDLDGDGVRDWPTVKLDSNGRPVHRNGFGQEKPGLTCNQSPYCMRLKKYTEVIFFLRQGIAAYGFDNLGMKGVYD